MLNLTFSKFFSLSRITFCFLMLAGIGPLFGQKIVVGVIGDQTGTFNLDASYQTLEKAVARMNHLNPNVVIHIGDLVESIAQIKEQSDYQNNFFRARDILNQLKSPWYIIAGDHDVVPPVYLPASGDRSRETWYKDLMQQTGFAVNNQLYYSFDFSGYHFIMLYSLENLHTDPRWGSIFLNQLSAEQIAWLKQDLQAHQSATGILVFVHHPHWYAWSNWSGIHEILRQYPVLAVVAGHYHSDQDDGLIDQIRYLVTGSTGGVIKNMDRNSGGAQEITLLAVEKNKLTDIKIYDVESDSILELTPRRSMDRLQALSCMLDNLYSDETIFEKKGDLCAPTGSGNYAPLSKIGLESISNPIDVPISLHITPLSDRIHSSYWINGEDSTSGNTAYILPPGARTGWSNYSSVGQWFKPNALWIGTLNPAAGVTEAVKSIGIKIHVSFQDDRERWIESSVFFPMQVIQ